MKQGIRATNMGTPIIHGNEQTSSEEEDFGEWDDYLERKAYVKLIKDLRARGSNWN